MCTRSLFVNILNESKFKFNINNDNNQFAWQTLRAKLFILLSSFILTMIHVWRKVWYDVNNITQYIQTTSNRLSHDLFRSDLSYSADFIVVICTCSGQLQTPSEFLDGLQAQQQSVKVKCIELINHKRKLYVYIVINGT